MKTLITFLILISLSIGGCARESGVLLAKDSKSLFDDAVCSFKTKTLAEDTTGSEQYRVYQEAASTFAPPSVIREEIFEQAQEFCGKEGKSPKILKETNPPVQLGCFTKAELIFICVSKEQAISVEDPLYVKLTNLKKLLDNGILTKDEFEQQKAKLLNPK